MIERMKFFIPYELDSRDLNTGFNLRYCLFRAV